MTDHPEPRSQETMLHINEMISETLARGDQERPIAFFCECANPCCYEPVWLHLDVYREARSLPAWAPLAPGHAVLSRTVDRAVRLRRDPSRATTVRELQLALDAPRTGQTD